MQSLPAKVEVAFDQITGKATPFLTYLDDWQRVATQKGKTLRQMLSTLQKFGAVVKEPMETLSGKHVQKWLDEMVNEKAGGPADANTKQRKLSDIRPYWKYLQDYEYVPSDKNPFENRTVANRETEAEAQERERIAYASWLTSIVFCSANGLRPLMIAAAVFFPIGVVHGVGIWFGGW